MNPVAAHSSSTSASRGDAPSPKLVKAAQEFEAILLSSWLEKLQGTFAGPDDGTDPAHGTLSSMGTQAIASALAARGGLGVARILLQHLAKPHAGTGPATEQAGEKLIGNPQVLSEPSR